MILVKSLRGMEVLGWPISSFHFQKKMLYTKSDHGRRPGRGKKYYADIKFHDVRKSLSNLGYTLTRDYKNYSILSFLWRNYRNTPFTHLSSNNTSSNTSNAMNTNGRPILNHLQHSYHLTRKADLATRLAAYIQSSHVNEEQAVWLRSRVPTTCVVRLVRESSSAVGAAGGAAGGAGGGAGGGAAEEEDGSSSSHRATGSTLLPSFVPVGEDIVRMEAAYLKEAARCLVARSSIMKGIDGGDGSGSGSGSGRSGGSGREKEEEEQNIILYAALRLLEGGEDASTL